MSLSGSRLSNMAWAVSVGAWVPRADGVSPSLARCVRWEFGSPETGWFLAEVANGRPPRRHPWLVRALAGLSSLLIRHREPECADCPQEA